VNIPKETNKPKKIRLFTTRSGMLDTNKTKKIKITKVDKLINKILDVFGFDLNNIKSK
jgi:hypothetical protein